MNENSTFLVLRLLSINIHILISFNFIFKILIYRFVYFNSMNLATKSILDKKREPGGQTIPKELLRLLVDVQQHQKW